MILLDFSSVAMSAVMVQIKEYKDKPDMVRHTIYNIIRKYNLMFREEYGEMVVCVDSKINWRRKYFPEYKAVRRQQRKNDKHDWKAIFEIFYQTKEEMKDHSPFRVIEVEGCEADDVIGTICEYDKSGKPTVIVSPDKDFIQLQRYPNISQYSNLQKKWVKPDVDPLIDLNEKVMKGDTGDGVPNVLTEDQTLMKGERQTPLSRKKLEALLEDPEALGTSIARRVIRNRTLIDLQRTPQEYKDQIITKLTEPHEGSIMTLMTLFTKNRMRLMLESLNDFEINTS